MRSNAIRDYRAWMSSCLLNAVAQIAFDAHRHAVRIVPYGNGRSPGGHLRDCITYVVSHQGAQFCGDVQADNPHALYVEYGTSRMRAQPYLRPALQENKLPYLRILSTIKR